MTNKTNEREIDALRADLIQTVELMGRPLTLHSTWGLFSPRDIDAGTLMLLDHLDPPRPDSHIVDLGCGYGPIGLSQAAVEPTTRVTLLDKDFVACRYAEANAQRNRLNNVEVLLSNGLSAMPDSRFGTRFDRLLSNVPAKVGKELWSIMLLDAWRGLNPGGDIWFVSINGLRDYFKRTMKEQFGNYEKIKQGRDYTIHRAEKR